VLTSHVNEATHVNSNKSAQSGDGPVGSGAARENLGGRGVRPKAGQPVRQKLNHRRARGSQ
jgi:hypothetical protein